MIRKQWFPIVPAVGMVIVLAGWSSMAQEPRTTSEKIKDKVGGAVNSIKKGAQSAEEAIKEQYARAKAGVNNLAVETRVYSRLHWDKTLTGSKIDLSAPKAGVIALSGTVADAKVKAKALELANDTVGVTEVIDHLTILTTTTTVPAKP
jgi:hyperosmotically inducible periplasmic protein